MKKILLFLFFPVLLQAQTVVKISNLPAATTIQNSDLFILNQGTTTKKLQYSVLANTVKDSVINQLEDSAFFTQQSILNTTWPKLKIDTLFSITGVYINGDFTVPQYLWLNPEQTAGFQYDMGNVYIQDPAINSGNTLTFRSFFEGNDTTLNAGSRKLATQKDLADTAAAIRASGMGSMIYPGAGIPLSTGSAWGSSFSVSRLDSTWNSININDSIKVGSSSRIINGQIDLYGDDGSHVLIGAHQTLLSHYNLQFWDAYYNTLLGQFNTDGDLITYNSSTGDTAFLLKNNSVFQMHDPISGIKNFQIDNSGNLHKYSGGNEVLSTDNTGQIKTLGNIVNYDNDAFTDTAFIIYNNGEWKQFGPFTFSPRKVVLSSDAYGNLHHYNTNGVEVLSTGTDGSINTSGSITSNIGGDIFEVNYANARMNDLYLFTGAETSKGFVQNLWSNTWMGMWCGGDSTLRFGRNTNNNPSNLPHYFAIKNDGLFEQWHSGIKKIMTDTAGYIYNVMPHAAIYRNADTTISIATQNVWYKFGNMIAKDVHGMTHQRDSIQLTKAGSYAITITLSFSGLNNEIWEVAAFKNSVMEEPSQLRYTGTTDVGNMTIPVYVSSDGNDWISFKVRNTTDTDDITIHRISILVKTEHLTIQ